MGDSSQVFVNNLGYQYNVPVINTREVDHLAVTLHRTGATIANHVLVNNLGYSVPIINTREVDHLAITLHRAGATVANHVGRK